MTPDPHTAGDTEAAEHVSGILARWLRTQPVLAALLALELPVIVLLVDAVLAGQVLTVRGVLLALAAPLVPIILAAVRGAVTPVARPQLVDDGDVIALVPAGSIEDA